MVKKRNHVLISFYELIISFQADNGMICLTKDAAEFSRGDQHPEEMFKTKKKSNFDLGSLF